MAKVSRGLLTRLEAKPDASVRLIVRVNGDLAEAKKRVASNSVRVVRSLELVNALVVTCRARDAITLSRQGFVRSVEEDRRVTTQS